MKTIKNGKSIRAWTFVFVLMLVLLLSSMIIWTSAEPAALSLTITATGDFRGKGDRFRASSGVIVVAFPSTTYTYDYEKTIGKVTSKVSYSYKELEQLTLDEEIMVEIRIDGSFRRLSIDETALITQLFIAGCEAPPDTGFQYCVSASSSNCGKVTRTGSNTWWVDASIPASIPASEQCPPSLCVAEWSGGNVVDGFCIPLYNFEVVCTGTIMK